MEAEEEPFMELTGDDARAFKEYDSKPLSQTEIESLKKAKAVLPLSSLILLFAPFLFAPRLVPEVSSS